MQVVTKTHLADFTEKLLENDKKVLDYATEMSKGAPLDVKLDKEEIGNGRITGNIGEVYSVDSIYSGWVIYSIPLDESDTDLTIKTKCPANSSVDYSNMGVFVDADDKILGYAKFNLGDTSDQKTTTAKVPMGSVRLIIANVSKSTAEKMTVVISERASTLRQTVFSVINELSKKEDVYLGKTLKVVGYGDSLIQSGNTCASDTWSGYMKEKIGNIEYIGVGIGGTKYVTGDTNITYPSGFTAGQSLPENIFLGTPAGTEKCSFCDWYRINKTIPNDADIILIGTSANDIHDDVGDINFKTGDTTDTEWAASEHYSKYNGDYDITKFSGAVLSTIMKIQCKAPNAKIFVVTPPNSRGSGQGSVHKTTVYRDEQMPILNSLRNICSEFGLEIIDLFSESGINPLNRDLYTKDGIHLNALGYTTKMGACITKYVKNYVKTL